MFASLYVCKFSPGKQEMLLFLYCVLLTFESGLAVEKFVITREEFSVGDKFDIPDNFCRSITETPKCSRYGAIQRKLGTSCECRCPDERSSLIYNGRGWNCTDDLDIRKLQNCAVHAGFEDPSKDQLVTRGESQVLLWNIRTKAASNTTCGLDTQLSRCLSCFDGWTPITDTERIKVFVDSSSAHLRILPPKSETLNGRIIQVVFNSGCAVSTIGAPCLLFKLQGQVNCTHAKFRPSLSTLSSTVAQPTSPVVEQTPALQSGISSSVISVSNSPNRVQTSTITSANTTTVADIQPTTKDNNGKPSNANISALLHFERRRVENSNMLLFIGLCVAPLFILLVILIFVLTCYRYRASRRGIAIIHEMESRETYENFVLVNPLFASDNDLQSSVDHSEKVPQHGFQNLGHIKLFRLEPSDVTDARGKKYTPQVYACPDERFASLGKSDESDQTLVIWQEGTATFSTFSDSFQKEGRNVREDPTMRSSPPPPYERGSYSKDNDNKERKSVVFIESVSDNTKNKSNKKATLDNSDTRRSQISINPEANSQVDNKDTKRDDELGGDDLFAIMRGLIDDFDTPRSSADLTSEPQLNHKLDSCQQKVEGLEILADLKFDIPSTGYPLYDFSFELVTE